MSISGVYGTSIDFSTGDDSGAVMYVELFDVCRVDSATREDLGVLYPDDAVYGMGMDDGAIVNDPGCCNKIGYTFLPQINETNMYTDNGDNTATIAFCAQVALYDGSSLVNLAEVKIEYTMQLPSQAISLATYTITDAAGFTDADDTNVGFDGSLQAYFCDPNSHVLVDYGVTGQGTVLSVCFKVPDGQFEIRDVMDLTIAEADGNGPSQVIISDSVVPSSTMALKTCYDSGNGDTNVCVVQFLLRPEFYETSAVTLTGSGTLLLELGDSDGRRELTTAVSKGMLHDGATTPQTQASPRRMQGKEEGHFMTPYQVKASRFFVTTENVKSPSRFPSLSKSGNATTNGILFALIVVACVLACCVGTCLIVNRVTGEEEEEEGIRFEKSRRTCPISATEFMGDESNRCRQPPKALTSQPPTGKKRLIDV